MIGRMSERNGSTLEQLREQVERTTLEADLYEQQSRRRLLETYVGRAGYAPGAGEPIDPLDQYRDPATGMLWRPLGGGQRDDQPEASDREHARDVARLLVQSNGFARGILEHLTTFVIGEGYAYLCRPKRRADPAVAEAVQVIVDGWLDREAWGEREQEVFERSRRDGEYGLRLFPQRDEGHLAVRALEPEHVRPPDGDRAADYPDGVRADPDDAETVLGYWYRPSLDEPGEELDPRDTELVTLNVDRVIRRGISDFWPVGDELEGARKLLRNMREGGAVQAAIAWIEQFDAASQSAVIAARNQARDQNRPYPNDPVTGRPVHYQRFEPGTVVKVGQGRTYQPAPLAQNTTQHIAIVQACLRGILTRWGMPEFFGGDASNANYASTLVSGSPFVRAVRRWQAFYRRRFLRVVWRAVEVACEAGRLPWTFEAVRAAVDIQCEAPAPEIADGLVETQTRQIEHQAGVLSTQTWRGRAGLDDETERQNLRAEPVVQAPAPGGVPAGNPLAALLARQQEQYGGDLAGRIADAARRLLEGR